MTKLLVRMNGNTFEVEIRATPLEGQTVTVTVNGEPVQVTVPLLNHPVAGLDWLIIDQRPYELVFDDELRWIKDYSGIHQIEVQDMEALVARPHSGDGRVKAPIPGLVRRLLVAPGDSVEIGQPLLVLEAMKMENEIRAPATGMVSALHVQPGQSVAREQVLAEIG